MAIQTQSQQSFDPELSIEEIYDLFMLVEEPDLMTTMVPILDEIYTNETPAEKIARGERYVKALELFAEKFETFIGLWKQKLLEYKKQAVGEAKKKTGKEEAAALELLEQSFGDLS